MSNWKDRLKNNQGGQEEAPKLGAIYHFEMKKNENRNNEVGFAYSKKDEQGNYETKFIHKPLEGILLGTAMRLSAFSSELGRNGGSYKSDYYWDRKNIKLYNPIEKKVACEGTMEQIEAFCVSNAENKGSKRQVLFVLTKLGVVTVTTNLTIAIDQYSVVRNNTAENFIKLTPELFNPTTSKVSSSGQKYLGKFAKKNPPVFASIELGRTITDEDAVNLKLGEVLDTYETWLNYKRKASSDLAENEVEGARPSSYNPHTDFNVGDAHDARENAKDPLLNGSEPVSTVDDFDEPDDLDFL